MIKQQQQTIEDIKQLDAVTLWPHVCYKFICALNWEAAHTVFTSLVVYHSSRTNQECSYVNLAKIYQKELLPGRRWIPDCILIFVECGANIRSLDGDNDVNTYFHRYKNMNICLSILILTLDSQICEVGP